MIEITNLEFENLISFVKINYGINLSARKTFVEMRLQKLMSDNGYDNFTDYFNFVCNDLSGLAVSSFISSMTINYTLFFRESYHFDYLNKEVLPYLIKKEQFSKDLRVWSAGCATGEEPYTLAMIIADFLGPQKPYWDMKILASDISEFALKKALVGSYLKESIEALNPNYIKTYFLPNPDDDESLLIAPSIKNEVIFRKFNLVGDAFIFKKKFHFIFCRNVMIYFDESTRSSLIAKFYDALEDGGYLFIGMSENIDKCKSRFKYVMPSVYRKEGD